MTQFMASIGFGLVVASVIAVGAVGFTLQFAVTDVLNLAFGAVMSVSAFAAYAVNQAGASIWVGVVVAALVGCLMSVALNTWVYTPFKRRRATATTLIIVSVGMTIILGYGLQAIVGGGNVSYSLNQGGVYTFLGMTFSGIQFVLIAVSVVAMLAVHVLLRYTRTGKAMRAAANNEELARTSGVPVGRVINLTWALSGVLCGVAGAVFAIDAGSFGSTSADGMLILVIAAAFVGGPGKPYGAMAGALIIGLVTEISADIFSASYKLAVAIVIVLFILAFRPQGLLST